MKIKSQEDVAIILHNRLPRYIDIIVSGRNVRVIFPTEKSRELWAKKIADLRGVLLSNTPEVFLDGFSKAKTNTPFGSIYVGTYEKLDKVSPLADEMKLSEYLECLAGADYYQQ